MNAQELGQELTTGFAGRAVEAKANRLVRRRSMRNEDPEDLMQELRIAVFKAAPRFDPAKAHWNAFVTTVIERTATNIANHRRAQKRGGEVRLSSDGRTDVPAIAEELDETLSGADAQRLAGEGSYEPHHAIELQLDLQAVLERLSPEERELCSELQGKSLSKIAAERGVARTTIQRQVRKIRETFSAAGLDDYFLNASGANL